MLNEQFDRSLGRLLRAAEHHFTNRRNGASVADLARSAEELRDARADAHRFVTRVR